MPAAPPPRRHPSSFRRRQLPGRLSLAICVLVILSTSSVGGFVLMKPLSVTANTSIQWNGASSLVTPLRTAAGEQQQQQQDTSSNNNVNTEEKKSSLQKKKSSSTPGFIRRQFPDFPWGRLPNMLTYVRCLAIPALTCTFYLPNRHVETSILFAVASFTDWLDGYLARRWNVASSFGAFLDPVADKLMVSTALILLSGRYGAKVAIPTAVILAREIAVSALREWMAQRGQRDAVKVGMQGKIKTALTMVALTLLLAVAPPASLSGGVGWLSRLEVPALVMLYASATITLTSGAVYFQAAGPVLFSSDD
jgi:CDP-diacylglycerol--glycerol-3-phosphate 3-phosphatidyltransferase